VQIGRPEEKLHASLADITRLLQKHAVLETFTHRQDSSRRDLLEHLQHQQNLVELHARCRSLHPADLAYVLESLPRDDRALVWSQTPAALKGPVLVEVADAVRDRLVDETPRGELLDALRPLDAEDLAYLEGKVPPDLWNSVSRARDAGEQTFLRETMALPDDSVGHVMSPDVKTVREGLSAGAALAELRSSEAIPAHTDQLFVVDGRRVLRGAIRLADLVRADATVPIESLMTTNLVGFAPSDAVDEAIRAFERYDLISAAVVDERGRLIGRVTFDVILEVARASADRSALERAGLSGDEDLFAPILDSARNRWPWLALNLLTAFVASRVIGAFEGTITQLVALATLMPIVASIGGNTGNQTIALVIRGLALDQFPHDAPRHLMRKELLVAALNGALWGSVVGLFALIIYRSAPLGLVMLAAVFLNLVVAAVAGVVVPLTLRRLGRDPAQGASVVLTFVTDSMGFLLFLGLARLFLI
jgi:magnesium transporter